VPPLERKNGWTLAEEAGCTGPHRIHRLLNRIEWDTDEVLDDVRDYVVEHLGERDAVLTVWPTLGRTYVSTLSRHRSSSACTEGRGQEWPW
jgi:hypothetical protein